MSGQEQLSDAWGWERTESGRWIAEGVRKLWEAKGLFNIIIVMVASFHLHVHVRIYLVIHFQNVEFYCTLIILQCSCFLKICIVIADLHCCMAVTNATL